MVTKDLVFAGKCMRVRSLEEALKSIDFILRTHEDFSRYDRNLISKYIKCCLYSEKQSAKIYVATNLRRRFNIPKEVIKRKL